ncbi:MAG: trimeric intracellular cation channel family protein [Candidatus Kapaibacterium sp.]|nr:trimeric intracellular cation channel family protein [Ignavibacteriota bacterium]
METVKVIEIAGTVSFSIAGAFAAMEKRLDLFGIFIVAFVAALGGGTLRDVLIGDLPVKWMLDMNYGLIVLLSTIAALLFTRVILNYHKILLLFDSIGLGFFTLVGIQTGITLGFSSITCIGLGTMTACFGGVIRDILLNNIPLIFEKEIYATTCITGGVLFFMLRYLEVYQPYNEIICLLVIVLFRLLAVKYDWQLPSLWNQRNL